MNDSKSGTEEWLYDIWFNYNQYERKWVAMRKKHIDRYNNGKLSGDMYVEANSLGAIYLKAKACFGGH